MPEYLRAYALVLIISSLGFVFARRLTANIIPAQQFKNWRNSWLIINSAAFLGMNYWLFAIFTFIYVAYKRIKEVNPIAFYVFILFAVPPIPQNIPGFGLVNYLFEIHYLRILSLAILLPLFLRLITAKRTLRFGAVKTDLFFLFYLLVCIGLEFRDTTGTDAMRRSVLFLMDWLLPYYVISRYVTNIDQIKSILFAFIIACIPIALIGVFEAGKHWLLYSSVETALNVSWGYGGYLGRNSAIRAIATFGHPIMFGYCMLVALGIYLYIKDFINNKTLKRIGLIIILLGLVAPLSRGPWVGAAVMYTAYLLMSKNGIASLIKFGFGGLIAFAIATQLPNGEKLINLIPFVGKTEQFNVEYREKLIDVSLLVVAKYPFFGKVNFREEPEMKQMVQGEGIIDIVNTYISVMLSSGYVGLFSFLGIFISAIIFAHSKMKKIRAIDADLYSLGKSLISILIGIMVTITTVGDGLIVAYIYYLIIALLVAYSMILSNVLKIKSTAN